MAKRAMYEGKGVQVAVLRAMFRGLENGGEHGGGRMRGVRTTLARRAGDGYTRRRGISFGW